MGSDIDQRTVAAVSTPAGTGGIAVIRVSGPRALEIAQTRWQGSRLTEVSSHTARLGYVTASDGERLDQAVATVFRGPNSYTGFDTVELSVHGSPWIQREVLRSLVEAGANPADGGEFTRQAFLNGKIDLAQVEGIADLIAASSRAGARVALAQTSGAYSSRLRQLRERLIDLAALLELELDFSEEDVEFADRSELRRRVGELRAEVARLADSFSRGKVYRDGLPVALAGIPNAGKSSLLNALLEEDKALVTDIPGTTRDIIEDTAEIGGILYRFYDTAGLRATEDVVESLGIDRALDRISRSSLVIWLFDPTQPLDVQLAELQRAGVGSESKLLPVVTKSDLTDCQAFAEALAAALAAADLGASTLTAGGSGVESLGLGKGVATMKPVILSTLTGDGMNDLHRALTEAAGLSDHNPSAATVTNLRHYRELQAALPHLDTLLASLPSATTPGAAAFAKPTTSGGMAASAVPLPPDLMAEELRAALSHLSAIVGEITTPTLLQTIFARFCIGK